MAPGPRRYPDSPGLRLARPTRAGSAAAVAVLQRPEPDPVGRRIALLNNKGGVGKTMLTLAFAEAAARAGRRVLAVDMDPQGNLSRRLKAPVRSGARSPRSSPRCR